MDIPAPEDLVEALQEHWDTCPEPYESACWHCALYFDAVDVIRRRQANADGEPDDGLFTGQLFAKVREMREVAS